MIRHKAFDNINIGLNEFVRVLVPEAAKESRIVEWSYWNLVGMPITLPVVKENYPREKYVLWSSIGANLTKNNKL
ncbi:TPA: hypothetical protein ACGRRN_003134 [Enterobacter ludwigii]